MSPEATQHAGIIGQIGRAVSLQARPAARSTTRMKDIVERGYMIIDSPEEVVEQLTVVATDLNIGHLMLRMQFGSMGKDLAAYNTKLVGWVERSETRHLTPFGKHRWVSRVAQPILRTGHSARLVVTMGMPALIYRWYFRAHGVRGLERTVLRFAGMKPVRETLFGMVDAASAAKRGK